MTRFNPAWDDERREEIQRNHERSVSYASAIFVLAYGGYLAIWAQVRSDMTPTTQLASGLLIAVSILIFISGELFKTAVDAIDDRKELRVLKRNSDSTAAFGELTAIRSRQERIICTIWPFIFWASTITGLGATIILFSYFIHGLIVLNGVDTPRV